MKILFISMPSIHVTRWIENLSDSGHELYWFDILDRGEIQVALPVNQITGWKNRKLPNFKGENFLRKKIPAIYRRIQPLLETTVDEVLTKIIHEIQPNLVHSFEMQSCSYPILKTMQRFPELKWVYSCWGSDLFYYQNFKRHNLKIREVLNRVDYLHTDCQRDFNIAKSLGFNGKHLDVIPGGTGYDLMALEKYRKPLQERKIILVKGYQHLFGRGLVTVEALKEIQSDLQQYEIVVFGAHPVVIDYIDKNKLPFKTYSRHGLQHDQLLEVMGKALVYIGNSISDGMPNTLLEAMVMGAFPIQSNPGGVTGEIINHGENGLLISNPENADEIKDLMLQALRQQDWKNSLVINDQFAKRCLDYKDNQQKVIALYQNLDS